MKVYIQINRDGDWKWLGRHSEGIARGMVDHVYGNKDNPASRGVTAVRVVTGKRNPVVLYERKL